MIPSRDLFPEPDAQIIAWVENAITQRFGSEWMQSFAESINEIISAGVDDMGDQNKPFPLTPSAYVVLLISEAMAFITLPWANVLTHVVAIVQIFTTTLQSNSQWQKNELSTKIARVFVSSFLESMRACIFDELQARSAATRFYTELSDVLRSTIVRPEGSNHTKADTHKILEIFTSELSQMKSRSGESELYAFLVQNSHQAFSTEKGTEAVVRAIVALKAPEVIKAFLTFHSSTPTATPKTFLQLPLSQLMNRSFVNRSVSILPDAVLWNKDQRTMVKLQTSLFGAFTDTIDFVFPLFRHALIPYDRQGGAKWLSFACNVQSEWTKERTDYLSMNDPSIAFILANTSFLLLEPMQNDDKRHFPRIRIEALFHPDCVAHNPMEEALRSVDAPTPPKDFHFTANLFFIGLNYFHLIAGMLAKVQRLLPVLRAQRESIDEDLEGERPSLEDLYRRHALNTCYRQQLIISTLLYHPTTQQSLRQMARFVSRWTVFTASGESSLDHFNWTSVISPLWRWVPQDLFWDIAKVVECLLLADRATPFSREEITYWIRFTTVFVSNTALITNKHHRASYAALLRILCERCDCLIDEKTCESVVQTTLRMYVDLESLGEGKYSPRHHLNLLLNALCKKQPNALRYLSKRASDMTEDFTKFISYSIADANYMLDNSILTLKSMSVSFAAGGNGGELEIAEDVDSGEAADDSAQSDSRTREGRLQSLRSHMEFSNEILNLLRALCDAIPKSLLQGLVTEQVAYMLDYFLTQLAGPRMREISSVPVAVQKDGGFDHRGIVESLVQCYVGIAQSPRRDALGLAMAADGHYYSPYAFKEIFRFLETKGVRPELLPKLKEFFEHVEKTFLERQHEDVLFKDPPDEFLCQITYELLRSPVCLPGMDNVWVESKAIRHHLLFDDTNPFNRQPLTSAELIKFNERQVTREMAEKLKREISDWKTQKRAAEETSLLEG